MSHHSHDEDVHVIGTINNETTVRHRSLKPTNVIDHLKTKVKRKRTPYTVSTDTTLVVDESNNNNHHHKKQLIYEHNKQETKPDLASNGPQTSYSIQTLNNSRIDDDNTNKNIEENSNILYV